MRDLIWRPHVGVLTAFEVTVRVLGREAVATVHVEEDGTIRVVRIDRASKEKDSDAEG